MDLKIWLFIKTLSFDKMAKEMSFSDFCALCLFSSALIENDSPFLIDILQTSKRSGAGHSFHAF
jgi:hypothetical protein